MITNMKTIITFVVTLTISAARGVDVYVYNGHEFYGNQTTAKPEPSSLFIFGYHVGDVLSMQIYLKNEALDVSSEVYLKYPSGVQMHKEQVLPKYYFKGKKYYQIRNTLNDKKIFIELNLYTPSGFCTRTQIVKGKEVTLIPDERNHIPYNDICLKDQWCVIEVDLLNNECGESINPQPIRPKIVLIYVIPSVTVMMCAVVVIYIVVKRHCHRNSHSVRTIESLELNTYATANEVTYAELCLVRGDRQPSRRDEESPYAEIIGVLNPR